MKDRSRTDLGQLVLRSSLASIFLAHGWTKFFGRQISFVQEMLNVAGWSLPDTFLILVAIVELGAGLALLTGVLSRVAATVLAVEMVTAVLLFHLRQGFFIITVPNAPLAYGFEFHLALVAGLVAVALNGPGSWNLSRWVRREG